MKAIKAILLMSSALLLTACNGQSVENDSIEDDATKVAVESETVAVSVENISPVANITVADDESEEDEDSADVEYEGDLDYSQFASLEELVWNEIEAYGYDSDYLSISIYDFDTGEEFNLNADLPSHGASTNKVGTAVLYADLINAGYLNWDSHLAFNQAWYEEGGGEITNGSFQESYSIYDLVYQALYYSDNTAWNTLINSYYSMYGDFQSSLIALSGLSFDNGEIYNLNYATSRMLNEILIRVATNPEYQPIVDIMLEAQSGIYLKMYVDEGMAAKYGQYEDGNHDTGIYFEDGEPAYTIAIMSRQLGYIDYFLGDLNLHVKEFHEYQTNH